MNQLTYEPFGRPDFFFFPLEKYLVSARTGRDIKRLLDCPETFFETAEESMILFSSGLKFYDCGIRIISLVVLNGHKCGQPLVLLKPVSKDLGFLFLSELAGPDLVYFFITAVAGGRYVCLVSFLGIGSF